MPELRPYKDQLDPQVPFAVLADAVRTGGAFGLVAATITPDSEPPLHVHAHEDETLFVLDGRLRVEVGPERHDAVPGSLVFCPRGVPHRYRVRTPSARLLTLVTPGGHERFLATVRRIDPADTALMLALADEYRCRVLTPPFA